MTGMTEGAEVGGEQEQSGTGPWQRQLGTQLEHRKWAQKLFYRYIAEPPAGTRSTHVSADVMTDYTNIGPS